MIIVKLQGGLGNQMFQYALARSLSAYYKTGFALDHRILEAGHPEAMHVIRQYDLGLFTLNAPRATPRQLEPFIKTHRSRWLGFGSIYKVITEPHFHFYSEVFQQGKHLYLDGYWQSEQYFQHIAHLLRQDFRFRDPVLPQSAGLLQRIQGTNAVCLNVRRGDFLQNSFHPVCGMQYYMAAIQIMRQKTERPFFYVFSDDKTWCNEQFACMEDVYVVGDEHDGQRFGNKLQLMVACRHFIIPNSSYGWWAAWLGQQPGSLVVAPQRWHNHPGWHTGDLLLPGWLVLPNEDERPTFLSTAHSNP